MKNTSNYISYNKTPQKGISWRAIFAGTVTALSLMLILNLIGLSIGLWSIEPTEENNPLSGLGTGSVIWWVISNLLVLFTGGFVAARLGLSFLNTNGIIHGVLTWALYTLFSAWLFTSVLGSLISGVGTVVGGVLSTTGQVVQDEVAPIIKEQFDNIELSLDDARDEFYSLLEDSGKSELDPEYLESQAEQSADEVKEMSRQPSRADSKVEGIFSNTKNRFKQSFEEIDKQALVNILVERTDMTENEARQTVDNTLAEFERARNEFDEFLEETGENARIKAENIAEAAGDASMYLAIALILGVLIAALGGYLGVKFLREENIKNGYLLDESDHVYNHGDVH